MKYIKVLMKQFKKKHPDFEIYLDENESRKRYYRIKITEPVTKISVWYTFTSGREFKEWVDEAIL